MYAHDEMMKADTDEPTVWYQWEWTMQILSERGKKSKRKIAKMQKVFKEGRVELALEEKLPKFLEDLFVKRMQAKYFEERIHTLPSNAAVPQVAFAENYTCKYQNKIQSGHWSQQQVTVFTRAIWAKDAGNKIRCDSQVIVSDELVHGKKSLAVLMDKLVTFVKQKYPQASKVETFSDGPSSQ